MQEGLCRLLLQLVKDCTVNANLVHFVNTDLNLQDFEVMSF